MTKGVWQKYSIYDPDEGVLFVSMLLFYTLLRSLFVEFGSLKLTFFIYSNKYSQYV